MKMKLGNDEKGRNEWDVRGGKRRREEIWIGVCVHNLAGIYASDRRL